MVSAGLDQVVVIVGEGIIKGAIPDETTPIKDETPLAKSPKQGIEMGGEEHGASLGNEGLQPFFQRPR